LEDHKRIVHGNADPSRGSKALAKRGKFVKNVDDDSEEQEE
jgi:hypothetical protein